jgi:uncharacterized protein
MSQISLSSQEDLFVVPDAEDSYYLYAPLRRVIVAVNRAAIGSVSRYLSHDDHHALKTGDSEVIESLQSAGLFSEPTPDPPITPYDYLFRPHEVTLFPTTRCNLRCVYCYAEAGTRSIDMPWEIAQAAIDFAIHNARVVGRDDFIVGFHGGGEPMMNWPIVQRATLYARDRAKCLGLDAKIHCASNGVLSIAQREFVVEHFTGMNISLDGPTDIQDRQRPLANGEGSFSHVMQTIEYFQRSNFPFGIRVTLTAKESHRLNDIVRFVHDQCPQLDQVHVEPVWQCGRCKTTCERPPSEEQFIERFTEASDLAQTLGFSLFYSGARLDVLTNKFCAAPGDGFSVTPEGIVSSCFEVTDSSDPRSELFHYGQYDTGSGKFTIDQKRVARLRQLRVENIQHCRNCFCKWHCAGDCLAKALSGVNPEDHNGSPRCNLNRAITRFQIKRLVNQSTVGTNRKGRESQHGS